MKPDKSLSSLSRRDLIRLTLGCSMLSVAAGGFKSPLKFLGRPLNVFAATPSISAADFGAKGDGVTDDTTSLQNAINASVPKGATLVIPPGSYVVTHSLKAISGLTLSGYGATLLTNIAGLGSSGLNN